MTRTATGEDQTETRPSGIKWHDLAHIGRLQLIWELTLPLPWLALSWGLFASPVWYLGFAGSFMFYLCALRLNHEAIHGNLGISRRGDRLILHGLSFLMGGSNNAVAHAHLLHHKDTMGPTDFEGKCGHMSFWEVLRYGPRFNIDITREAWRGGSPKIRRRILIDWVLNGTFVALAVGIGYQFLILHAVAILAALCLSAFFAVWITHQGTHEHGVIARSQRGIIARLAYLMLYHREHHLFPKVPVSRLPDLAARLDREAPGYAESRLPVIALFDRAPTATRD